MNRLKITEMLVDRGNELFNLPYKKEAFTENEEADELINDLKNFPHAYVLACIMDRQIKAERAWSIPYYISLEIGGFEFEKLMNLSVDDLKHIFKKRKLHRFNDLMAENFYSAIQHIHTNYKDDASNIWKDKPKSATLVLRFLEFKGVGVKISTMAANILARDFKVPIQDKFCIDISPDVHIKRVFTRLGFISNDASNEVIIYCAREMHPDYPGIFDYSLWEIGRTWCRPKNPDCKNCYLNDFCPKNI